MISYWITIKSGIHIYLFDNRDANMQAIEASCPNSWYIPQENHAQQVHTVILITRLFFNAKLFLHFLKKFVHYRLKSTFLKSCISLSLCRSNCFFFIHIPCFLNGLSSKGANKCIVDSCDMLNISVWVVKARAQVDLSLKQ